MSHIGEQIEDIIKEIGVLKISNQRTVRRIKELETKAHELQTVQVTQGVSSPRHWTGHRDKHKRKIYIGDTVKYLTSGKYSSTQGVVSGFSKSRVTSTDDNNNEIPRAPHNLLLIS